MKYRSTPTFVGIAAVAMLVAFPGTADACGVCMGRVSDSQIPGALNGAVFMMLGFIGSMLAGIGTVAYSIYQRSRTPLPAHVEFTSFYRGQNPTI